MRVYPLALFRVGNECFFMKLGDTKFPRHPESIKILAAWPLILAFTTSERLGFEVSVGLVPIVGAAFAIVGEELSLIAFLCCMIPPSGGVPLKKAVDASLDVPCKTVVGSGTSLHHPFLTYGSGSRDHSN